MSMSYRVTFLAIVTLFSCVIPPAWADYRCKVERLYNAAGEGKDSIVHQQRKTWIGKEFSVARLTGTMSGALKNNYLTRPVIVDSGSANNSFKVVATLTKEQSIGGGSAVFTLIVNEYVDTPQKPFVFLSNDDVYFGQCRHDQ
jgi:hypothetical protein